MAENDNEEMTWWQRGILNGIKGVISNFFLFGNVIAICISWSLHHSISWALIHGGLGWAYVFYFAYSR